MEYGMQNIGVVELPIRAEKCVDAIDNQMIQRGASPTVAESLREILQYRELLYMLTWRDIKARYKQSAMGFLWAILMPVLIVAAGMLLRIAFSLDSKHQADFRLVSSIALKSLPWAFFVGAIKFATNSIVVNANLVTKIYFPRELFPLASVLASLFDAAIASSVTIILLVLGRVGISLQLLWVPLILALIVLFTSGLGMSLSCANLFFRDAKYLVDIVLMFGIFFTPVFYDARMLGKWEPLILLNPLSSLLEALNSVVILHQAPSFTWLAYAACCSIVGLVAAWVMFDHAEPAFAESI
jgi:ABC-type polysaccharide/polyol phosphate export permease